MDKMTDQILKIGTRGSPLALKQTEMVENALKAYHPSLQISRIIIKTSGDWKPEDGEKKLSEIEGGKGLFVREIEKALMDGEIDCAVHSMKDMPSFLPQGLAIDHVLPREDARDAFICRKAKSFYDLPAGSVVGTSSARRQSILLSKRPDLSIVTIRGNVATRIAKMDEGLVDATFLAMAGLNRLDVTGDYIHAIEKAEMTPACGQGIVAIETRESDLKTRALLDFVHHAPTHACGVAERKVLQVLDGSCHTPIGAHASLLKDDEIHLDIFVGSQDGQQVFKKDGRARFSSWQEIEQFAGALAMTIKMSLPDNFLK